VTGCGFGHWCGRVRTLCTLTGVQSVSTHTVRTVWTSIPVRTSAPSVFNELRMLIGAGVDSRFWCGQWGVFEGFSCPHVRTKRFQRVTEFLREFGSYQFWSGFKGGFRGGER
jgi:hypothetical protein